MLTIDLNAVTIITVINMYVNKEELGKRIAMRRKSLKIKQEDLAAALGVSNNHISSVECGKSSVSLELLCGFCEILKVTPDYLLMGAMHSNKVPQNIMDSLQLCSEEQIALVSDFVQFVLSKSFETIFSDKSK